MTWYLELNKAIANLLGDSRPEAQTLLSVLLEPVYGSEQELAVAAAKCLEGESK
jgi:hypothetical protein